MRDGNVPRFFCGKGGAGKAQLVGRLAAQLSGLSFPARSCSSFLGDCWHRKKKQKEGRKGTGGWEGMERKKLEGMEESGKLLVEQIKTKRRVPAPRCIILLSHNLLCLFNDLKEVIDIHKTIRKVGIAENINSRFRE